jgi:hypothetical protein
VSFFARKKSPNRWAGFDVLELGEASAATGLTSEQLMTVPGVQRMTRTLDGEQEQALLVPCEVLEIASVSPPALAKAVADYNANRLSDAEFRSAVRDTINAGKPGQ